MGNRCLPAILEWCIYACSKNEICKGLKQNFTKKSPSGSRVTKFTNVPHGNKEMRKESQARKMKRKMPIIRK